jgi:ABC-2 type transport system ATP-binding protein
MPIIQTRALRKTFRSVRRGKGLGGALGALFSRTYVEKIAVENINITIQEGEVVGYIGPNGAGKSTTIKMLTGILVPTSGSIEVAGITPHEKRRQNARNIGVVFGQRSQLYWDLPLRESFELLRAIYKVPRARFKENLDHFVEILNLEPFLATPVRQLSLGERMRGDFAAALLHDPRIVYLDEPTIGLDVVAKEAIRAFIDDINKRLGTTVILTTHDLADVERLCRRLILIDHGMVIYDGSVEGLRDEYGTHRTLVVTLNEPQPEFAIPGVEVEMTDALTARLRFDRRTLTAEALIRRVTERYPIRDVAIEEPAIDDIVRRIYLEGYFSPPPHAADDEDA